MVMVMVDMEKEVVVVVVEVIHIVLDLDLHHQNVEVGEEMDAIKKYVYISEICFINSTIKILMYIIIKRNQ